MHRLNNISIFLYQKPRCVYAVVASRLSPGWSYRCNDKIVIQDSFVSRKLESSHSSKDSCKISGNSCTITEKESRRPRSITHMIFMIDRGRLWLLATRERERDWIRKEPNERETPESVLTMQTKRTRTQGMHAGYFTAGSPQHHFEDAAVARRCLHRSLSL